MNVENNPIEHDNSRRKFFKKLAYIPPVVMTLSAVPYMQQLARHDTHWMTSTKRMSNTGMKEDTRGMTNRKVIVKEVESALTLTGN
jgi:hypothetical protein